ncbi:M15 family metallopeptidase [Macrococcoides caseolyticum]|uniref:M15 family metallopeptidase n=1 Tax=Macrococcoides caseolyticum TaxID=69966 RepID=UPI001F3AF3A8|nr:M15 family metallopeptidase [Macrococcus caseolyticus]MCE4957469.1 M15 family metallopeptidase [Macrococcus caseolyticus]
MKKPLIMLAILLLSACNHSDTQIHEKVTTEKNIQQENQKDTSNSKNDSHQTSEATNQHHKEVKDGITYIDNILIVNKAIALPKDYAPGVQPEAEQAIQQLMAAGEKEGLNFAIRSGFRSYDTQSTLYNGYVARDGKEKADTYSAQPGHSEHQTGLAFDLGNIVGTDDFKVSFEDTNEGKWLKAHAHEYGFIIRYPKGKTSITGYQYEPWHVRYLGKSTAQKVTDSGLTLEEYLGLK